jgi:hypothetical protein
VHRPGGAAIAAVEECRGDESAAVGVRADQVECPGLAVHDLGFAPEPCQSLAHFAALAEGGHRSHAHLLQPGIADHDLAESRAHRINDGIHGRGRHQRLADRSALLSGLYGHLAHHLAHEQLELRRARPRIRSQDRGVERVRLGREAHRMGGDAPVLPQQRRGARRAGERHHILAGEVIEQVSDAAADQLHRPLGQDPGPDDSPEHPLREVAGLGRRLDDRGDACKQRRRELLQHAPHGKVEGIDMHRRAFERHADVLADESAEPGERLHRPLDVDAAVGQLALALARVHEKRPEAAVDIDPGIAARGPGRVRHPVELLLVLAEVLRQRLEECRALVEREPAQVRATDFARVPERRLAIESVGVRARHHLAGGGIAQRDAAAAAGRPFAGDEALKLHVPHSFTTCPSMRYERPRNSATRSPR